MRPTTRLAASLVAVVVALTAWAPTAAAVGNADAAKRAATFVAAQAAQVSDVGVAADSLLALAAGGDPAVAPQAGQLVSVLTSGAAAYAATSPEAAAKLVVASVAIGRDPKAVGGVNVVDAVKAGLHADGSFGSAAGATASAWGMLALVRAGEPVPAPMLQYLVKQANGDGGFGRDAGQASDAESTGMAVLGLATQTDSISARDTVTKAVAWATAAQQADGSWSGTNPVVATALLGSGLQAAGFAQPKAVQYLVTAQLANGALPSGGNADLAATQRAALLLGDTSYVTVSAPGLVTAAPTQPPQATTPASSPEASATAAPSPAAPPTGAPRLGDGNNVLWVLLPIVLLGLLAGGFYYLFIRPDRVAKKKAEAAANASADAPPVPATQDATPDDSADAPATPDSGEPGDAPAKD